ncbi:LuxR C-terminal-related transcriptional regulator [Acidicapsa dinghuensis]|uniref:LuxR C-terminal-related transcriptional regulator n=1 Tax=Acidicapsa dinghuensis TaxID=2218256 RepID=A0ABW1EM28_9BACT|nr:response regulator transcription factor [Acidicapsa dinghuensis]
MHWKLREVTARIGVVSREPIRLAGLETVFEKIPSIELVNATLHELLADSSLGYIILDLSDHDGWIDMQQMVRSMRPDIRQIVLGPGVGDEMILRSIMAGARAFLHSSSGAFAVRRAVESVIQGTIWAPRRVLSLLADKYLNQQQLATSPATPLSPREKQVLDLIMTARSNREIADELGIEERTVKAYVASLLRKTGAENRVSLSIQKMQESMRSQRAVSGWNSAISNAPWETP